MRSVINEEDESFDLPLTPILDIVFLLLIFFLVSTHLGPSLVDIEAEGAEAQYGEQVSDPEGVVVINIRRDGALSVSGEIIEDGDVDKLQQVLYRKRMQQQGVALKVYIRPDRRVSYGDTMRVVNVCNGIDGLIVSLTADRE